MVGGPQVERIVAEIDRIGDWWLWWVILKWRGLWQRLTGLEIVGCGGWFTNGEECGRDR